MDVVTLIRSVMAREPLWDRKHRYYHDRSVTMAMWEEVANIVHVDSDSCRAKWKGLRDTFRTELKKLNNIQRRISPQIQATNWEYFNEMVFVKDQIYLHARPVDQAVKDSVSAMAEASEETTVSTEGPLWDISFPNMCKTEVVEADDTGEHNHRFEGSDSEETPSKRLRLAHEEDDNYNFLLSLGPQLKALPLTRNAYVRMKIQELIYEELADLESKGQLIINSHEREATSNCDSEKNPVI